jgi:DNA repair exonuclease SbcCD ATPase subunit
MRLLQAEITNFKAIKYLKLDLENADIIVLTGDNGQGKSSFLEALAYLFTDELNDKLTEYINWDEGVEKFNIYGKIEIKDSILEIWVEVSYKGTSKHMVINGEEEFYNSDVTKKLKTIFNPKLLKYSSSAHQHENTAILFERPADRLNKLKSIFGLDLIPDASREINDDLNIIKTDLAKAQTEKQMLDGKQFNYLEEFEINFSIDDLNKLLEKLNQEKEQFAQAELLYQEEDRKITEFNNAQNQKESLLKELISFQELLNGLDLKPVPRFNPTALENLVEELNQLDKERTQTIVLRDKQSESLQRLENLKKEKQAELDAAAAIVIPTEKTIDEEGLTALQNEINDLKVKQSELQKSYRLALSGKCPTCNQNYSHSHEDIKRNKDEVDLNLAEKEKHHETLRVELANNRKINSQIALDINKRESFLRAAETTQRAIDLIVIDPKQYSVLIEEYDQKIAEKTLIKEAQKKLQIEYNAAVSHNEKSNTDRITYETKIDLIQNTIGKLDKMVVPVHTIPKPEWKSKDLYLETTNQKLLYDTKLAELNRIKSHNASIKKQEEETLAQKKILEDKMNNYHFEIEVLNNVKKILEKDFSSYIIEEGSTDLRNEMNNYFQKTYGKFNVDLRKDNKSIDFFYSPREGIQKPVSMSSGFEKASLALSFRVALMKFQENCLPMFDEIDSDASDKNSNTMYEHLLDYDGFDQIFCITHKQNTIDYLINEKNAFLVEF